MCELYAASSAVAKKISFSLHEFRRHGGITGDHVDGWGLAFFNIGDLDIHREAKPAALSPKMDHVLKYHKPSDMVISHIRKATQGKISLENTQPFKMDRAGTSHVFVHNGNIDDVQKNVPISKYFPRGQTDSEHVFCYLMEKLDILYQKGLPTLEQKISVIEETFNFITKFGPANFIYTDGEYLYAFANQRKQADGKLNPPGLHYLERDAKIDADKIKIPGLKMKGFRQNQVLLASVPLSDENWIACAKNQLIVVKFGKILYSSH